MSGVRWSMLGVWYPIMLQLHRFMIAVSQVSANHDGERCREDGRVGGREGRGRERKRGRRVNVDLATLPGPHGFLDGPWVEVSGGPVTESDVAAWPYSVSLRCEFSSFMSSLHWPADSGDLGLPGGFYFVLEIW